MKCYKCKKKYDNDDGMVVGMVSFMCCNCFRKQINRVVMPKQNGWVKWFNKIYGGKKNE